MTGIVAGRGEDRGQVRRQSGDVDDLDGPRPRPDRRRDGGRIDIDRQRVDVDEDRTRAQVEDRLGRGRERVGGHDDLVALVDPEPSKARWSAAVALLTATAWVAPT